MQNELLSNPMQVESYSQIESESSIGLPVP
jgi:hypothetical protein